MRIRRVSGSIMTNILLLSYCITTNILPQLIPLLAPRPKFQLLQTYGLETVPVRNVFGVVIVDVLALVVISLVSSFIWVGQGWVVGVQCFSQA